MTNFCRWIAFKAVAYGPASVVVCFISQVGFRFLSVDFIMILKDQSIFSASTDEIRVHGIRDFRIPHRLNIAACSLRKWYQ